MAKEIKEKSLRKVIIEMRGKIDDIQNGFKKRKGWKEGNYFRFVLLVNRNIKFRKEDIELAKRVPQIYLLNEDALEYYNELYGFLKPYAKYNFLVELRIRDPDSKTPLRVPAFKIPHGNNSLYMFSIDPRELIKVAYVARRERGNQRYYQRLVKKERLNKIKKYIEDGGKFPNNIIIAFNEEIRGKIKFIPKKADNPPSKTHFGVLEFPREYRSCWIVDGQHRLFAYINSNNPEAIQVSALTNLGIEEQGKIFLDINKNQKPVPTDLVWDLNGELTPNTEDGVISRTVAWLNFHDRSGPLYHKIYFPSLGLRKKFSKLAKVAGICLSIKRAGLAKKNTKSKVENPLYDEDPEKQVKKLSKNLSEYFSEVKNIFNEDWKMKNKGFSLDDGGLSILVRLYEKIIEYSVREKKERNRETFRKYLTIVKKYFEEKYPSYDYLKNLKKKYFSSEAGKDQFLKELCIFIRSETGEDSFGGNITGENFSKKVRTLERNLAKFISDILSSKDVAWEKERIPGDIRKRVKGRIKSKAQADKRKEFHEFLTLGEQKQIIEKGDNFPIFEEHFIGPSGFENKELFLGALAMLIKYRNPSQHSLLSLPRKKQEELHGHISKIEDCILDNGE